jgi:hypothetical protein
MQQQAARLNDTAASFRLDDQPRAVPAVPAEPPHNRAARTVIAKAQASAQTAPALPPQAPRQTSTPNPGPSDDWESF